VQPHNIIWNKDSGVVKLTDFGVATVVVRTRETTGASKGSVPIQHVLGSMAYLAPELSLRHNHNNNNGSGSEASAQRAVDYRSDFYSLGITFFELLTGSVPFVEKSAVRMMHAHMAKQAPRVHEVDARVPKCVSAVVQRLLAKSVETRYQSSRGLIADLLRCQALLLLLRHKHAQQRCMNSAGNASEDDDAEEEEEAEEEEFEPGKDDVSDVFRFPAKLYGREKEITMLRELYTAATKSQTKSQVHPHPHPPSHYDISSLWWVGGSSG
jgi:serine/threonine protein kinase